MALAPSVSIGVASEAQDFNGMDGILGVGPVDLTQGTVSNTNEVPTVMDNLFAQGLIMSNSLGISYELVKEAGEMNGELTFGGTDSSRLMGEITFTLITVTSPTSNYWGIDQTVTYSSADNGTLILSQIVMI
ncbi:hypothetical protein EW145_g8617 [Phellinidium pouzarii]|uniref:Peptidase A1 domain-containing protein n=1 Tax=Phellinidium pouzarii TaxID=167371 RepID=A0A4S4K4T2_9AGAM|nr:hypothetical protein EW145_g8617 [Phellinidium pouzarii]